MKKIILLAFIATSSLFSEHQHQTINYKLPVWKYVDCALLQSALIVAAYSAKYQAYTFNEIRSTYLTVFRASADDSSFVIRFDSRNRECEVEFNAVDDSFNYDDFKKTLDFFFIAD